MYFYTYLSIKYHYGFLGLPVWTKQWTANFFAVIKQTLWNVEGFFSYSELVQC